MSSIHITTLEVLMHVGVISYTIIVDYKYYYNHLVCEREGGGVELMYHTR